MIDFEAVKEVIIDKLSVDPAKVTLEARFVEDLGADSLEIVGLIMGFEDRFGINISDSDAEKLRTVRSALEYINSQK